MSGIQKVIKYCAMAFAYFLIISIFLGIFGAVLWGVDTGVNFKPIVDYELVSNEYDFTEEFEDGKVKRLDIRGLFGEVTIKNGDVFKVDMKNVPEDYEASLSKDGTFYVGSKEDSNLRINLSFNVFSVFDGLEDIETEVIITIPKGAHFEEAMIEGASGKLTVSDISADEIEIDGGSGLLTVSDIETDKFLLEGSSGMITINGLNSKESSLNTASGLVTIKNCEFGTFNLDSGSGMVKMTGVKCDNIDLESGSGLINIEADCDGDIEVSAGSGNVTLTISGSESSEYEISVDAGSGGIWVNGNRLSDDTVLNKGAERNCNIDGGSGRISVEWK